MNSTCEQDVCACGCGRVILPTDNHPWFKLRSCQQVWTATMNMPEAERAQWCWDQRFYFSTLHSVTWGTAMDWDYEYTDHMVISYANARMEEARYALEPFDANDLGNLADALRILTHWDYMTHHSDKWMGQDKLPEWVFTHRARRRATRLQDTLRQYGIVPASQLDAADAVAPA